MHFTEIAGEIHGWFDLEDMAPCRVCGVAPVLKENQGQATRLECPKCGIRTRQSTSGSCYSEWNAVMGGPTREQMIAAHVAGEEPPRAAFHPAIRPYERGDAPEVRLAYLRGVILQDNSFNYNGHCVFIRDAGSAGPDSCGPEDLFVEVG